MLNSWDLQGVGFPGSLHPTLFEVCPLHFAVASQRLGIFPKVIQPGVAELEFCPVLPILSAHPSRADREAGSGGGGGRLSGRYSYKSEDAWGTRPGSEQVHGNIW